MAERCLEGALTMIPVALISGMSFDIDLIALLILFCGGIFCVAQLKSEVRHIRKWLESSIELQRDQNDKQDALISELHNKNTERIKEAREYNADCLKMAKQAIQAHESRIVKIETIIETSVEPKIGKQKIKD